MTIPSDTNHLPRRQTRRFKLKQSGTFDEVMDFFTMLMVWQGMPAHIKIEVGIPQEALSGRSAAQVIKEYQYLASYIKRLIPQAEIVAPEQTDTHDISFSVITP